MQTVLPADAHAKRLPLSGFVHVGFSSIEPPIAGPQAIRFPQTPYIARWFVGLFWSRKPAGPGGQISRFDMILSVTEHEMQHRGQLMLIERVARHHATSTQT